MKFHVCTLAFLVLCGCAQTRKNSQTDASPVAFKTSTLTSPAKTNIRLSDLPPPFASESASQKPKEIDRPAQATLQVPAGFQVKIFAENLKNARWTAVAPNGDVFVVQSKENKISVLRDNNKDGAADQFFTFAEGKKGGLDQPFGIAFQAGHLYVANTSGVVRYTYQPGQTEKAGDAEDFITGISSGGYNQHWTRNILFDKNRLFLSIGSESNVDADPLPRASIQVYDLNGKNAQTYAHGLRNPIGLAVHPTTGVLYTAVNERDELGDNLVPDYLTSVREGGFYGWPYAYLSASNLDPRRMKDGKSERPDLAEKTITPEVLFESHSAALGLAFYTGKQFPEEYRGDAFVAFHGSWNRSKGTGYKVVRIPFDQTGKPKGGYEDFLTGWLTEPETPAAWGRPVGVTMAPDGSMLITDDTGGVVWRVSYTGKK